MSLFLPNIPQAGDNLDFSQGELLTNNQGLDTVFGIDHYKFSDATSNKGFHNQVTTPAIIGGHPATAANIPKLYAATAGNLGVVQFSKGPNLGATQPSNPITMLQSPLAPIVIVIGGTTNVFDFTGLPFAMCVLVATDSVLFDTLFSFVTWNGAVINIVNISSGQLTAQAAGAVLRIKNANVQQKNNVFWTLQFMRVQ
jgi:hypothetical protein